MDKYFKEHHHHPGHDRTNGKFYLILIGSAAGAIAFLAWALNC